MHGAALNFLKAFHLAIPGAQAMCEAELQKNFRVLSASLKAKKLRSGDGSGDGSRIGGGRDEDSGGGRGNGNAAVTKPRCQPLMSSGCLAPPAQVFRLRL